MRNSYIMQASQIPRGLPPAIEKALRKALLNQADVYVVPELTEISEGYMLDAYEAEDWMHDIFPSISTDLQSGTYRSFDAAEMLRNKMEKRADGGESAGSGMATSTKNFSTYVWAWHTDVGPQLRANTRVLDLDEVAARLCSDAALINREYEWVRSYFKAGVWATQVEFDDAPVGAQRLTWMDDDSDPIADMRAALLLGEHSALGKRARAIGFSEDVWERLLVHPKLRGLWGGQVSDDGRAVGSPSALKRILGEILEVEKIRVAKAMYTTSEAGNPTATYDVIVPTGVGMFYYPDNPSPITPSAGYTFNWTGYIGAGEQGQVITRETIPLTRGAVRTEIEQAYGYAIVSPQAGVWLNNVLTPAA